PGNQFQLAANLAQKPFHDAKPQARTAHTGTGGFPARKRPQQSLDVVGGNAASRIPYFDGDYAAAPPGGTFDAGAVVFRCAAVAARVFDQVADDALEIMRVDAGEKIRFDVRLEVAAR